MVKYNYVKYNIDFNNILSYFQLINLVQKFSCKFTLKLLLLSCILYMIFALYWNLVQL